MVEREQPSSPVSSEHDSPPSSSHSLDIEPTKKRSQKQQTASPSKKAKTSPTKSPKSKPDGVITNEIKAAMVDAAFDMAYKQLPFDQYAAESGIAAGRLKDQFKPNRANLRAKLVDVASGNVK